MLTTMRLYGRTGWTDGSTTPGRVMPSLRKGAPGEKLSELGSLSKSATTHGLDEVML